MLVIQCFVFLDDNPCKNVKDAPASCEDVLAKKRDSPNGKYCVKMGDVAVQVLSSQITIVALMFLPSCSIKLFTCYYCLKYCLPLGFQCDYAHLFILTVLWFSVEVSK